MRAGRAEFTVTDTGPGIAPRDLPHLFEPLYRGEASRNRETGGVGLGLAIAQRILRAHGGDLVAANRAGSGAAFTGWLPLPMPRSTMDITNTNNVNTTILTLVSTVLQASQN